MGDVVNLRQARKAKARACKQAQAAANRTAFGRSKADKAAQKAEQARTERAHEAGRLTPPTGPPERDD